MQLLAHILSRRNPLVRPTFKLRYHQLEVTALFGELIRDTHRLRWYDLASDHFLSLEFLEPERQRPIGDLGNVAGDLRKSARAVHQRTKDRAAPALPNQLDRLLKVRAKGIACARIHH